jgi:hypothetical protein
MHGVNIKRTICSLHHHEIKFKGLNFLCTMRRKSSNGNVVLPGLVHITVSGVTNDRRPSTRQDRVQKA